MRRLHWLFTRIAAEGTHAPHTLTAAAYVAYVAYVALTRSAPATAPAARAGQNGMLVNGLL
ncbi:MAG: hypothetical protein V4675_07955 [Verrucomicrobiota bacterium]